MSGEKKDIGKDSSNQDVEHIGDWAAVGLPEDSSNQESSRSDNVGNASRTSTSRLSASIVADANTSSSNTSANATTSRFGSSSGAVATTSRSVSNTSANATTSRSVDSSSSSKCQEVVKKEEPADEKRGKLLPNCRFVREGTWRLPAPENFDGTTGFYTFANKNQYVSTPKHMNSMKAIRLFSPGNLANFNLLVVSIEINKQMINVQFSNRIFVHCSANEFENIIQRNAAAPNLTLVGNCLQMVKSLEYLDWRGFFQDCAGLWLEKQMSARFLLQILRFLPPCLKHLVVKPDALVNLNSATFFDACPTGIVSLYVDFTQFASCSIMEDINNALIYAGSKSRKPFEFLEIITKRFPRQQQFEHIISALDNAIKAGCIGHVYTMHPPDDNAVNILRTCSFTGFKQVSVEERVFRTFTKSKLVIGLYLKELQMLPERIANGMFNCRVCKMNAGICKDHTADFMAMTRAEEFEALGREADASNQRHEADASNQRHDADESGQRHEANEVDQRLEADEFDQRLEADEFDQRLEADESDQRPEADENDEFERRPIQADSHQDQNDPANAPQYEIAVPEYDYAKYLPEITPRQAVLYRCNRMGLNSFIWPHCHGPVKEMTIYISGEVGFEHEDGRRVLKNILVANEFNQFLANNKASCKLVIVAQNTRPKLMSAAHGCWEHFMQNCQHIVFRGLSNIHHVEKIVERLRKDCRWNLEFEDIYFGYFDTTQNQFNQPRKTVGDLFSILEHGPPLQNLFYDSTGSANTTLIENVGILWETEVQMDTLTLVVTDFVKPKALESVLARLQVIVTKSATVFTKAQIDDNIRTWLLTYGFQLSGSAYFQSYERAYLMHLYKAVSANGIEIIFGISDPVEQNKQMSDVPIFE
uniref:Uncharacterized protein n=1 Tax=Panagrolaimus sp. JU765 TaxID=591449 RepID=A0AC34RC45_9BILA